MLSGRREFCNSGPVLGQSWASLGPVLGQSWASLGPVLGQSWASLGPLRRKSWGGTGFNRRRDILPRVDHRVLSLDNGRDVGFGVWQYG
jgi:hypothetical protein